MTTNGRRESGGNVRDDHRFGDTAPGLVDSLRSFLGLMNREPQRLGPALAELERRYDDSVYSELIYLLSHLRFDPDDAKLHWRRILEHAESMQAQLGATVDPRLALVSYFTRIHPKLDNPKVIELELFQRTQASAYRDELTGLHNYRFFEECLAHEALRSEQYGRPLSLVMVDVDDFKGYNDRNGHDAGNQALMKIGRLLEDVFADAGVATRYGGEEFAVILPMMIKLDAQRIAEQARAAIEATPFPGEETQPGGSLTVSIGIATFPGDARRSTDLVSRADRALYDAKACGRNQIRLYAQSGRSYRRVDVVLAGELRVLAEEHQPIRTRKLSEGGALLVIDRRLTIGSLVDLSLELSHGDGGRIATIGRVVTLEERADGRFDVAIRFTGMEPHDRRLLREHIRRHSGSRASRPRITKLGRS